jgi:hypothetical protein
MRSLGQKTGHYLLIIFLMVGFPHFILFAQEPKNPLPIVPPAGHPRLFLRPADLPEMQRRMADPFFAKAWKRVMDQSAVDFDGQLSNRPANYDTRLHDVAESCALR